MTNYVTRLSTRFPSSPAASFSHIDHTGQRHTPCLPVIAAVAATVPDASKTTATSRHRPGTGMIIPFVPQLAPGRQRTPTYYSTVEVVQAPDVGDQLRR